MKDLRITPIRNGTVIDHIRPGMALRVLKMLELNGDKKAISIAMHAHSKKEGYKDIVKIEDKELKPREVNRVAIVSPDSTINIIRDYQVVNKYKVTMPEVIEGIVKCENLNCITNQREPVESKMIRTSDEPPAFRCFYCGRYQREMDKHII